MAGPDGLFTGKAGFAFRETDNTPYLYVDSDGYFRFNNTEFSGNQLHEANYKALVEAGGKLTIGGVAGSYNLGVSMLPSNYRYIVFSMVSEASYGAASAGGGWSFWLTPPISIGREIFIWVAQGSTQCGLVTVSTSLCSLVGIYRSAISGFRLWNSSNSSARVRLVATESTEWSVISGNASYVE